MSEKKQHPPLLCLHCGNKAPMTIVGEYSKVESMDGEGVYPDWEEGPYWEILECLSCGKILFGEGYWHEMMHDAPYENYSIVYPIQPSKVRGLPPKIDKAYEASQKVKSIDSNAYAVLLGRVLDLVCIDKNAEGESLFERLGDIANKGIMPDQLAEMGHAVRQLRNIGAHADLGELTSSEVPVLESFSKAILEYVYFAPALLVEVQKKIDSLKSQKTTP